MLRTEMVTAGRIISIIGQPFLLIGYKPEIIQTDNGSEFTYTAKSS